MDMITEYANDEHVSKWFSPNFVPSHDLSIFETTYDHDKKQWVLWKSGPEYRIPKDVKSFHDIFIPTTDSIRHHHIL